MSRKLFRHGNKIGTAKTPGCFDGVRKIECTGLRYARRLLLAGIGAALLFPAACQSSLVYHPERRMTATPESAGIRYEDVALKASDGVSLAGWWVSGDPGRETVLFCHGNAGNISYLLETIRILRSMGLNVFVFDYRGFGTSGGKPSEKGTYKDVEAAWRYLVEDRKISPADIVLMGRSLGGSVAAYCAMKHPPRALILESAFTSMGEVMRNFCSCSPASTLVVRYRYETIAYIRRVKCPVLVIHSRYDEVVPFSHGLQIFEAAPQPKELLEIRGDHNRGFLMTEKAYETGIMTFLQKYGSGEQ